MTELGTPGEHAVITRPQGAEQHFDVLIVGAGLSGIGAACHLRTRCPDMSYAILEARQATGGTWDLFRYPGVRSDSDMYTLGYAFRPWTGDKSIADGASILDYVRDTARENDVDRHIRFGHRVQTVSWSSEEARWTVDAGLDDGGTARITCGYLLMCSGYYSYASGHMPEFAGSDDFKGRIVHPQFWPQDLDYAGKRVVVVGSGATAVTVVPAMAATAEHVTMLQRSPTYVVPIPSEDKAAHWLRQRLPSKLAYRLTRWKNVALTLYFYNFARKQPEKMKARVLGAARKMLGPDYDIDTHFTPSYNPWDQRLCLVPDGDLFKSIRSGKASVTTDHIDHFTATGMRLRSGTDLDADIVVMATGLRLNVMGDVSIDVDGDKIDLSKALVYKGTMLSGVPNFASVIGYTNASWTLKADITCSYVCRLLNYMKRRNYDTALPVRGPSVEEEPFFSLTSGYVQRGADALPKQGSSRPWKMQRNYLADAAHFHYGKLTDGSMKFTRRATGGSAAQVKRERVREPAE